MKIAFLPLDTRPCTYDFPVQLARQAGGQIVLPPAGMVASYKQASNTQQLATWVQQQASECQAMVISAEQLLQGGLIPSREAKVSAESQIQQLDILARVKQQNPSLRIYLSTVLMRTSISTLGPESLVWWGQVNEYSKLLYLHKTIGSAENEMQLKKLEGKIPPDVLSTFLLARKTNHKVNSHCIALAQQGVLELLLILQEDCSEKGVQRFEQTALANQINNANLQSKVHMFNGTDEAGAELIMRALHHGKKTIVSSSSMAWKQPQFHGQLRRPPF